nr:bacterial proteasome activator family protein [Cellulomonas flavigena]
MDHDQPAPARPDEPGTSGTQPRVVVVPPQQEGPGTDAPDGARGGDENVAAMVGQPAKVMRIGTMIKQLLDEVRSAPLDDAARARLAEIHERSLHELEEGLSPELLAELHRITLPFTEDQAPSDAELRIAQAQLVGWLEGLFHGIQTALVAQQMAAQAQLTQMRRALPPGHVPGPGGLTVPHADEGPDDLRPSTGQYL